MLQRTINIRLESAASPLHQFLTCSAVEASGTTGPDTELPDALDGGLLDHRVPSEAEVVVRRKVQAFLPVDGEVFAGLNFLKNFKKRPDCTI